MKGVKVNGSVTSVLPTEELPAPGVIRAVRGSNPVNASPKIAREMAPMEDMATARVKHPKLNGTGWNTEYAQARDEPKTARPKSKYNARKRRTNERGGRRGGRSR